MYLFQYRMITHKITIKIYIGLEIYIRVLTFSWDWDIFKVFEHFYDNSGDRKHISHICCHTESQVSSFADAFFNCEQQND